jgi:hypothetical protein
MAAMIYRQAIYVRKHESRGGSNSENKRVRNDSREALPDGDD